MSITCSSIPRNGVATRIPT